MVNTFFIQTKRIWDNSAFYSKSGWIKVILLALCFMIISCSKDDEPQVPTPAIIFSKATVNVQENSTSGLDVGLSLSGPLEEPGTVVISIDNGSTAMSADYMTSPAAVSGTITLSLAKGANAASFTLVPVDNGDLNEDKTIVLTLRSADGGITLGDSNLNATVIIVNDDVTTPEITTSVTDLGNFGFVDNGQISESKSYTVSGTGLTTNVSVTASENFMVSLDNLDFDTSVEIPFANANSGPIDVFVRFNPATGTDQEITGTIKHSSGGSATLTVTTSGTESGNVVGDLLLNENFDYGAHEDKLTTLSPWENYSGSNAFIQYMTDGLSLTGYGSSGIGGAIAVENGEGSREDVMRTIDSQNSGSVYTALLIQVSSATASETGDFFLSLRDPDGKYFNRLYARDDGNGNLLLGTTKTRSGSDLEVYYSAETYSYNTTYLIVIKYDFTTKVTSMNVITGSLPATEPATPDVVANTGEDPASFEDIIIRQSADDIAVTIDGIRIAKNWSEVLGI